MQQLDALTLAYWAKEQAPFLIGAKINKVQHLAEPEFLLGFWGKSLRGSDRLYISLHPHHPCCFITPTDSLDTFVIQRLNKPTGFCMLLRKHLMNARVTAVETLPGERVLNLRLENTNELGNKVKLTLSLELMGNRSNMILIDDVSDSILGVAKTVSATMSQYREVAVGLPYLPPPTPQNKRSVLDAGNGEYHQWFQSFHHVEAAKATSEKVDAAITYPPFWGAGLNQLKVLAQNSPDAEVFQQRSKDWFNLTSPEALKPTYDSIHPQFALHPHFLVDSSEMRDSLLSFPSVNELLNHYFQGQISSYQSLQLRQPLQQALKRQQKKLSDTLTHQSPGDETKVNEWTQWGNLLLTAISEQKLTGSPNQKTITLMGYDENLTETSIEIELNSLLSWVDNAKHYFNQVKKERTRQKRYTQLAADIGGQQEQLREWQYWLDSATTLQEVLAVQQTLLTAGLIKSTGALGDTGSRSGGQKIPAKGHGGILTLPSSDGLALLVGKSGEGNAAIVGKVAQPDDIWLHVHQMPGSHVLIQCQKQSVPDQTLLEAANLAVYYSAGRESNHVPVVYTAIKHVRKIPQSYPGHVTYQKEQTVFITVDPLIIEQLFMNTR